jgi:signal transduction histidine kinase
MDALGTLAGGIAHDLNNTLVPVVALTECVQASLAPDDPNGELLALVRDAAGKARDLVNRILTFSRQELSDKKESDLACLLNESMRLLRATIPATIAIEMQIGDLPPIMADAAQIHQVMLNLVTNAAQAIGDRTGKITISAQRSHEGEAQDGSRRRWICLSVSDTGSGISDETQRRMFEPFFTTKLAGEGTGLGLPVVHGIVTGHGGTIQVTSRLGEGTTIDVYLPATNEISEDGAEAAQ